MNDWIESFSDWFYMWFEPFMDWFLTLPLIVQVSFIIGITAVLILTVILVYYILKGVAYLIYYLFKGLYLLLKAIFTGIYKLFKELYYAISGRPKPNKQKEELEEQPIIIYEKTPTSISHTNQPVPTTQKSFQEVDSHVAYCSECGNKFTERMSAQIHKEGQTYCVYCGKGFRYNDVIIES
jgi:hypothetical protein